MYVAAVKKTKMSSTQNKNQKLEKGEQTLIFKF